MILKSTEPLHDLVTVYVYNRMFDLFPTDLRLVLRGLILVNLNLTRKPMFSHREAIVLEI
jgi:hypothetical protein